MDIAFWVIQGLLALAFGMAGFMKLTQPKEKIQEQMGWVEDFSQGTVRIIGLLELLAAIGLILPSITGILPILTPIAAAGLVLVMVGAAVTHFRRGEMPMIPVNLVLMALAAVVVYGRFIALPL